MYTLQQQLQTRDFLTVKGLIVCRAQTDFSLKTQDFEEFVPLLTKASSLSRDHTGKGGKLWGLHESVLLNSA